jgi:hypothetical protein
MSFEITGKTVERELFETVEHAPEAPSYLRYREAIELVRTLQPGNPKDPKPDFAYEVFVRLERLLGIENQERLSFYTAIGSALDHYHGVDGWFELDDGGQVTVDLTANQNKTAYKADIVFHIPGDGLDRTVDAAQFEEHARALAEQVGGLLTK